MSKVVYAYFDGCDNSKFLAGKRYLVIEEMGNNLFTTKTEYGGIVTCAWHGCAFLNGGNWKREEFCVKDDNMATNVSNATTATQQKQADVEAYKEIIECLLTVKPEELVGIALEAAKANPAFFNKALVAVREKGVSHLVDFVGGIIKKENLVQVAPIYKFNYRSLVVYTVEKEKFLSLVVSNILNDKMVHAIKEFRTLTGCGLKEAKDICDLIRGIDFVTLSPSNCEAAIDSLVSNGVIYIR